MYIIEALVLYRNLPNPLLSFRSTQKYEEGSVLVAPLKQNDVFVLVVSCQSIVERKLTIKHVSFELKPLKPQEPLGIITPYLLQTIVKFAEQAQTPLHTLISTKIFERFMTQLPKWLPSTNTPAIHEFHPINTLIQDILESEYSLIIICPSVLYLRTLQEQLTDALESDHTLLTTFYGGSTAGEQRITEQFLSDTQADGERTVILTTSSFIPFIYSDTRLTTILIEPENIYHQDSEHNFSHAQFLLGTADISVHCYGLTKDLNKYISTIPYTIIERKDKQSTTYISALEAMLPKKMLGLLSKDLKQKKTIGIFSLQTGYSSAIFCTTCKKVARCPSCDAKLHKHVQNKKVTYRCHNENKDFDPWDICQYCGALSLIELGVGTEQLEEYLREYFPTKIPLFRLDAFKVSSESLSPKKITAMVSDIHSQGGILIGSLKAFLSTALHFDSLYILDYDQLAYSQATTFNRSTVLALIMIKADHLTLISDDAALAPTPTDILQEALLSAHPHEHKPHLANP
ncbi:MAG TPA: hypothetical protein VGE63_01065 [Candidatus Paceibacterota bacterium]